MTVDLATLVATTKDFQAEQLKVFGEFVDNTKAVVSTMDNVQTQAEEQFKTMDETIKAAIDAPTSGSEKAPIEMLKYDKAYVEVMDNVTIEPAENHNSEQFCQYVDDKSSEFKEAMDKRQEAP